MPPSRVPPWASEHANLGVTDRKRKAPPYCRSLRNDNFDGSKLLNIATVSDTSNIPQSDVGII